MTGGKAPFMAHKIIPDRDRFLIDFLTNSMACNKKLLNSHLQFDIEIPGSSVMWGHISRLVIINTLSSCRTWTPPNTGSATGIQKQTRMKLHVESFIFVQSGLFCARRRRWIPASAGMTV